ncbi:MAG: 30S ribosomal protein S16 [Saprospiraceae bacterium]
MAVKIRLARRGRKKKPFYHIIVADARSPRDGRFIEKIGIYNPLTVPATIEVDNEKAFDWLMKGAQPTDTAKAILRYKGVLYKMHLAKGVKKGAFSQEVADKKYAEFISGKESKIQDKVKKIREDKDKQIRESLGAQIPLKVEKVEVRKEEVKKEEE